LRGKNQKRAERAQSLRRALTQAELTLWIRIRGRRLGGFKFARQEPRLIIELDGGQHAEAPKTGIATARFAPSVVA
jgi:very-short-patch-repair endonuclease